MNPYEQNYGKINKKAYQKSFEFVEYPQLQEYYSNQMNSGYKRPRKIIVTEIYDELIPKNSNSMKRKEFFNFYTESKSPYHKHQKYKSIGQKKLFSQYNNINSTGIQDMNYDSNFNQKFSEYNKGLYLGGTDLREEYSSPSNNRVNIRKKIYRGSNTPQPIRNYYNSFNGDEDFIENFQYYESKNIKDKSNKKYQSITRVTGYSNLVPLNYRRMENSITHIDSNRNKLENNFNNVSSSRYNYFKELKHNYSNADVYQKKNILNLKRQIAEKKRPQTPEKISQVQIQKTTKKYEIQKKPQTQAKTINVQYGNSKRKYESTKMPISTNKTITTTTKTTTKTTNVQTQNSKRKYESSKVPSTTNKSSTTTKAINIQYGNSTRKYESAQKPVNTNSIKTKFISAKKETNTKVQNYGKKYETQKKQETAAKSTYSKLQKTSAKKYDYKIDMSKYKRDGNQLVFKKSTGRYQYKDNISDKDVLNSRKNNNSETKNIKKVEVVQNTKKKEEKKRLDNIGRASITHTNKESTSYKKIDNSSKKAISNKISNTNIKAKTNTSNFKNTYNTNNNHRVNKVTTQIKSTITTTKVNTNSNTNNNNNGNNNINKNKGFKNSYKSINSNINLNNISNNNKRGEKFINSTNVSNYSKKNYQSNIKLVDTSYNEGLNANKYKKDYYNTEIIRASDISGEYLNNSKSAKKIYDNSNIGFLENKQITEMYELEKKREKQTTPKLKTKLLGDNYKYYESKFMQNPNENTNINSYTLHQRRNERVIYGTEEIVEPKKNKSYKKKQQGGRYKVKGKKIIKKKMVPINIGDEGNYAMYNNYYQRSYNYNGGREEEGDEYEYDDSEEENNFEQNVIYY